EVYERLLSNAVAPASMRIVLAASAVGRADVLRIAVPLGHNRTAVHLAPAVGAIDQPRKQVGVVVPLRVRPVALARLAAFAVCNLRLYPLKQVGRDNCLVGVLNDDPGLALVVDGERLAG